jgi:adenylate cyclase
VGINSGPMVVGNMGSNRRFNYTVMGDSVNLGSRLEGLNKVYGTGIIASETTWERVKEEILGRELDAVRVKGKGQPVRIFELLAVQNKAAAEQTALARQFQSALAEYRKRNWDGALTTLQSILVNHPGDGPARVYVARCRTLKENPPPPDWDGVYTLTTK